MPKLRYIYIYIFPSYVKRPKNTIYQLGQCFYRISLLVSGI